jgi:hypothetical protein
VLLFAFQGEAILAQPLVIALLAVRLVNRSKGWYEKGALAAAGTAASGEFFRRGRGDIDQGA